VEDVILSQIAGNPRYPSLEEILGAIADWINRYREAYAARSELVNCGADEVARIAHDLGISSNELATLAAKDANSADLLQKMLVALGVDPKNFACDDPAALRDLQRLA
jgi:transcriptional regulator with XRE-family HTH domain